MSDVRNKRRLLQIRSGHGVHLSRPITPKSPTPGHYVEIQLQPNQTITDMENALDASANIVGVDRRWWWKEIESDEGVYDWTSIDAHLASCLTRGKRLVVFLMDKGFAYDGEHPLPADMQIGGAHETEFEYIDGAYGAARWHTRWRSRMKNILQLIFERYDGHPAFEGVALQETPEGGPWATETTPAETVGGETYTNEAAIAAYVDVFSNTAVYRPRSYLYWYGTFFGPPSTEGASMAEIRTACIGKRVAFGITNTRAWPHQKPAAATGWPNSVRKRVLDTTLMKGWVDDGLVVFAAHQANDYKYSASEAANPKRDILYNYERVTRNTATTGPGGDAGLYDWCAMVRRFVWNYQKSAVGSTYKQRFDASIADNTLGDALSIINTEPRWWENAASYQVSAAQFDGLSYLRNQGASALAANGGDFTIAFWVNMAGSTDGALYTLLSMENTSNATRFLVARGIDNKIYVVAFNTSGLIAVLASSTSSVLASSGWQCVLISGKRSTNTLQLYLYDENEYPVGTWNISSTDLNFADIYRVTWGASWNGDSAVIGKMASVYFANWFTDLSYEKLRRAFCTDTGMPVYPGYEGRRSDAGTGVYNASFRRPLIYIGNPDTAADWNTGSFAANRGSWCTAEAWDKVGTIAAVPANELPSGTPPPPPDPEFTMSAGTWPGTLAMRRQTVTPAADSTAITIAFWINRTDGFGAIRRVLHMASSSGVERGYVRFNADDTLTIRLEDSVGTLLVSRSTPNAIADETGWTCVMISVDQVANKVLIYFDDVEQYNGTCNSTATPISYGTGGLYRWSIGGSYSAANPLFADLGNLVVHHSQALDFTQEAVRRKFIGVWGHPIDMGADGSLPFTSPPYIYMGNPGDYADWDSGVGLNLGTLDSGADWNKTGTGSITEATPP